MLSAGLHADAVPPCLPLPAVQVKPVERIAIQFLFDCLDAPTISGIAAAQRKAEASLGSAGAAAGGGGKKQKKAKGAKKGGFGGGGKGFGASKA